MSVESRLGRIEIMGVPLGINSPYRDRLAALGSPEIWGQLENVIPDSAYENPDQYLIDAIGAGMRSTSFRDSETKPAIGLQDCTNEGKYLTTPGFETAFEVAIILSKHCNTNRAALAVLMRGADQILRKDSELECERNPDKIAILKILVDVGDIIANDWTRGLVNYREGFLHTPKVAVDALSWAIETSLAEYEIGDPSDLLRENGRLSKGQAVRETTDDIYKYAGKLFRYNEGRLDDALSALHQKAKVIFAESPEKQRAYLRIIQSIKGKRDFARKVQYLQDMGVEIEEKDCISIAQKAKEVRETKEYEELAAKCEEEAFAQEREIMNLTGLVRVKARGALGWVKKTLWPSDPRVRKRRAVLTAIPSVTLCACAAVLGLRMKAAADQFAGNFDYNDLIVPPAPPAVWAADDDSGPVLAESSPRQVNPFDEVGPPAPGRSEQQTVEQREQAPPAESLLHHFNGWLLKACKAANQRIPGEELEFIRPEELEKEACNFLIIIKDASDRRANPEIMGDDIMDKVFQIIRKATEGLADFFLILRMTKDGIKLYVLPRDLRVIELQSNGAFGKFAEPLNMSTFLDSARSTPEETAYRDLSVARDIATHATGLPIHGTLAMTLTGAEELMEKFFGENGLRVDLTDEQAFFVNFYDSQTGEQATWGAIIQDEKWWKEKMSETWFVEEMLECSGHAPLSEEDFFVQHPEITKEDILAIVERIDLPQEEEIELATLSEKTNLTAEERGRLTELSEQVRLTEEERRQLDLVEAYFKRQVPAFPEGTRRMAERMLEYWARARKGVNSFPGGSEEVRQSARDREIPFTDIIEWTMNGLVEEFFGTNPAELENTTFTERLGALGRAFATLEKKLTDNTVPDAMDLLADLEARGHIETILNLEIPVEVLGDNGGVQAGAVRPQTLEELVRVFTGETLRNLDAVRLGQAFENGRFGLGFDRQRVPDELLRPCENWLEGPEGAVLLEEGGPCGIGYRFTLNGEISPIAELTNENIMKFWLPVREMIRQDIERVQAGN